MSRRRRRPPPKRLFKGLAKANPNRCHVTPINGEYTKEAIENGYHAPGCTEKHGRCRWRSERCHCPAYRFPHRPGSGMCARLDEILYDPEAPAEWAAEEAWRGAPDGDATFDPAALDVPAAPPALPSERPAPAPAAVSAEPIALSLHRHVAWAIVTGKTTEEIRRHPWPHRGEVYLHACKSTSRAVYEAGRAALGLADAPDFEAMPHDAIVARATVTGCRDRGDGTYAIELTDVRPMTISTAGVKLTMGRGVFRLPPELAA